MTIIERVEQHLAARDMKKKAAYDTIGVSASTYSTWVAANVTSIPSEYIPPLARLFGVTCDELLTGETQIVTDERTRRLIEIYNGLTWEGQQLVIGEAIREQRTEETKTLARA